MFSSQKLISLLQSEDAAIRTAALQSIMRVANLGESPDILPRIKILSNDPDVAVRFWAKKLLSKLERVLQAPEKSGPAANELKPVKDADLTQLFWKLKKTKDAQEAIGIIKRILLTGAPDVCEQLLGYLDECRDIVQISFLTKSIGRTFPSEDLLPRLTKYLKHEDDRVVANTLEGIEAIGTPPIIVLCAHLLGHRSHRVRANSAKALAKYDPGKASEVITRMLSMRDNPNFIIAACHAIKELKNSSFLPTLAELAGDQLVEEDVIDTISHLCMEGFHEKLFPSPEANIHEGVKARIFLGIQRNLSRRISGFRNPWARPVQMKNIRPPLEIGEQKIFALREKISFFEARKLAEANKAGTFSFFSKLIFSPDEEKIKLVYSEIRYEPFWQVRCQTNIDYTRSREEIVPSSSQVIEARIGDKIFSPGKQSLKIPIDEHCVEQGNFEIFVDAQTGSRRDFNLHVQAERQELRETEELMINENIVVPAKVKASIVVRDLLAEIIKPVKADEINAENIFIEKLLLFFRPVFAFEFSWEGNEKSIVLEIDGITGEIGSGKAVKEKLGEIFSEATLFEIVPEAMGLVVPGAELVAKLARAVFNKK